MNTKKIRSTVIGVMAAFTAVASGTASADPSQLVVVRASDGSLWKADCNGTSCGAFASFPGNFGSQPALTWDEDIQRYVLWGRASNGTIWRSTFSRTGVFFNDWVSIPGNTANPPAAAGGGIVNNFVATKSLDMTSINIDGGVTNLKSIGVDAPFAGFVNCSGTGTIQHVRPNTTGNTFARVYLTETTGGTQVAWSFTDLPAGYPAGTTSFPFGVERWFSVAAGGTTMFMTAEDGGGNTTTTEVYNPSLSCNYQPYSY